ncbi:hypothetical protein KIH86_09340 [Paenibacillus sp. HN-1]|uniref:hypothetical protein n=1 Tax=Paenibacillus TaxID=44249 RepID=UPI001CA8EB17|nr:MULTISPECIES: hypothetical protein [Paenibacillus]MBY9077171.1 hypothetical protein [Paenibacillus sp. CGMCC 1.18879]MBY9084433.1 hypothetical protein [Paenibacillus sinensis]
MNQQNERELGWDDTIQKDGGEFTLLPAGDYNFTVTKFERGRFAGSDKMPACNQAKLELTVHSPEHGDVVIFHNLFLHTKTEGLLSNFFAGIGQKRKGEPLRMNWNAVIGARGRLKLEINKFRGRDGEEKTNNQVKSFYPADELPAGQQAPQYGQAPQYNQNPPQYQQTPFPTTPPPQGGNWSNGQF